MSNIMAYCMLALCVGLPVVLLIHGIMLRKKWESDLFLQKVGTWVQGMKLDDPDYVKPILFFAELFFIRRMILCATLIFWTEFFWGQVAVQFMISTIIIIVILWFRPMESIFATKMELFNECTNLMVLYLLMIFSDFVRDPETRSNVGTFYICVIIAFAGVHIIFMLYDSFKQLYWRARRRFTLFVAKRKQAKKLKEKK